MKNMFMDPFIFNYVIMCLYGLNSVRFSLSGMWADMFYWMGALWITAAVTFGYDR